MKTNVTVSKGFTTWLGLGFSALAAACAAVVLAFEGLPDDTPDALVIVTLLGAAALAISKTIDGRMKQATAMIEANPDAAAAEDEKILAHDETGEADEADELEDVPPASAPSEADLKTQWADEPPSDDVQAEQADRPSA